MLDPCTLTLQMIMATQYVVILWTFTSEILTNNNRIQLIACRLWQLNEGCIGGMTTMLLVTFKCSGQWQ